jgi:hypothetical protein
MAESVTRFLGEDASLGKTIQNLEGRLDGFGNAAANVQGKTSKLPATFVAVAAGVLAFVASLSAAMVSVMTFRTALEFTEKLNNLKAATGESAANLVLLQRAFDLTGSSADKVGPAINKVQELIAKAGEGAPKAVEKLNLLGLSFGELKNLSPAEQMEKVMKAIDAIPDPAERARAAMAIFGTQLGRELLPLIKDFDAGMAKAAATLGSLPRIIETYGPSMSMFSNAIDALKKKPEEFAVGVVGPMSTLLGNLAQRFAEFDASGFGESIGLALNNALIDILVWVERGTQVLQGVWAGLEPAIRPVLAQLTAAWDAFINSLQPYVQRIGSFFDSIDYTAIGKRIGEQFAFAFDVALGIWQDPSKIFGLYSRYLDFTFRKAADDFLSFFVTAVEAVGRALIGALSADFFKGIAQMFVGAIIVGIAQINLKFLDMIESVLRVFTGIWDAVTGEGVINFAKRLYDMIVNFGKDFISVLTNPIGFFTGQLASALVDGTKSGADAFKTNYDKAAGGFLAQARAGLEGLSTSGAQTMTDGFNTATGALVQGVKDAVTQTEGFKSNIFGSVEAGQRLNEYATQVAEKGREYKESLAQAATSMAQTKLDVTGPDGIAPALDRTAQTLNATADKTQSASGTIVTAFQGVATSGNTFKTATDGAGQSFAKQADAAGRALESGVRNAMKALTDSVRGFATEGTLQKVVSELQSLNRKLPQNALTL